MSSLEAPEVHLLTMAASTLDLPWTSKLCLNSTVFFEAKRTRNLLKKGPSFRLLCSKKKSSFWRSMLVLFCPQPSKVPK